MAIPEAQLDTWSKQGAGPGSRDTYKTIKLALEDPASAYADKTYKVFLQGSYGNDTNIYSESDVDTVIELESTFNRDIEQLPQDQKNAYLAAYPKATYHYKDFKRDVLAQLTARFGGATKPGVKAVQIEASASRRKADVIIALQYRRYERFRSLADQSFESGISFFTSTGSQIINYPRQHSTNCTIKHQATNGWFKPMVRIFKNARSRLVDNGQIAAGVAPSYYIEGLLYNVPDDRFGGTFHDSFMNCMRLILEEDRSEFMCANGQYQLLDGDPNVTWSAVNCTTFLEATAELWNEW